MTLPSRPALAVLALACGLSACASRSEFGTFATLGQEYAATLQPVAEAACQTQIDADSWKLIDTAELGRVSAATLSGFDESSLDFCARTDRLVAHAGALGAYFGSLRRLTAVNQDGAFGAAAAGSFADLAQLGQLLRAGEGVRIQPDVIGGIVNAVVNERIEDALRRELVARKDALAEEFATLEAVLEVLKANLDSQIQQIRAIRGDVQVYAPLVLDQVDDPATLVETRRFLLRGNSSVQAMDAALQAARQVRESFETLITEDPGTDLIYARIEALAGKLTELRSLLATLRA